MFTPVCHVTPDSLHQAGPSELWVILLSMTVGTSKMGVEGGAKRLIVLLTLDKRDITW